MTTARPQTRRQIVALLERHGLHPRKHLGQHFLADPNVVARIVRLSGVGPGDRVLEIGVGTGTLTMGLAATGARVLGLEVDSRLRGLLDDVLGGIERVEIRFDDALEADLGDALEEGEWTMVANLPYNVATPLLIETLRDVPQIRRYVVMVQKEVAARLVAGPGSADYGIPSVAVALRAEARRAFVVAPHLFVPRPEVESAVVEIERRTADPLADRAEALAAAGFHQRRKMLRRSLAAALVDPEAILRSANLDPRARAEDLSASDYLRLARQVS